MSRMIFRRRHLPAALVIAAAALAIGAVLGTPRNGQATGTAAPVNSATPTISGTPQQGSTLTADHGSWSGNPTSYLYSWSRCNQNGDSCTAIAGATSQEYELEQADVGHTMRVTVTAANADGPAQATSAPTALVSSASAPANTAPPTISGTVQVGSTLTAGKGDWNGSPTAYAYAWSRCDPSGGSCAAISGATGDTYQLKQVDVGSTLRVTVVATNSAGSTSSTSAPTAVVPATVVNGCPATGSGTIQVADVAPPARLAIDGQAITPTVVTRSTTTIQTRFRVTACGRPVQGALLYATAVPFNQYSVPAEQTTGADGTATLTMTQLSGFPAARRQQLLVVFARARKPGEPLTGGVSTRLLVSFPVSLR